MDARKKAKEVLRQVVSEKQGQVPTLSFPEVRERFLADTKPRTKPSIHAEYELQSKLPRLAQRVKILEFWIPVALLLPSSEQLGTDLT